MKEHHFDPTEGSMVRPQNSSMHLDLFIPGCGQFQSVPVMCSTHWNQTNLVLWPLAAPVLHYCDIHTQHMEISLTHIFIFCLNLSKKYNTLHIQQCGFFNVLLFGDGRIAL